jgi:hypothetical protein
MNQITDIVVIFLSDFVFVFVTNVFSYVTSIVDWWKKAIYSRFFLKG